MEEESGSGEGKKRGKSIGKKGGDEELRLFLLIISSRDMVRGDAGGGERTLNPGKGNEENVEGSKRTQSKSIFSTSYYHTRGAQKGGGEQVAVDKKSFPKNVY